MSLHPTLRLVTLLLVSMMTVMAGATIAPALPSIRLAFEGAPGADLWVRLMLTLPGLFTAIGAPIAGSLIDRFGRKPLLLGAIALYGVSGTLPGLLSSLPLMLFCRALLGLSVGGLMTTATALIADYYEGPERGVVLGRQAAFMALGGVVFLLGGGVLADLSWRAPFAIYLFAFLLLPLVLAFITEPARKREPGGGPAPRVALPWESLWLIYALGLTGMTFLYMSPVQLPFLLRGLGVTTGLLAGLGIATGTLVGALVSLRYGWVRQRLGYRSIVAATFGLMAAGFALVGAAEAYGPVLVGMAVAGLGQGLMLPNLSNWAGELAPGPARGRVLGGLTTSIFLGQFLSPLVTQPFVDASGYGGTFLIAGGVLAALSAAFTLLALSGRRGP
jgi:MFS family permease